MPQALHDLAEMGVAVWLDDLSRPRLQSGALARMVAQGEVVGITTNPTIFAKAILAPGANVHRHLANALRTRKPHIRYPVRDLF